MRLRLCLMFAASLTLVACGDAADDSDDCVDSECSTAPAPSCQDGLAIAYESVGSCVSNRCAYEATTTPCAGGCAGAVCSDQPAGGSGEGSGAAEGSGTGEGSGQ